MKRIEAAVAMLELLDRRRAEANDQSLGDQIERDLVDLYIRDLDPDRVNRAGMERPARRWLDQISFLVIGIGPYGVLLWLLWPGR